MARFWSSLAS